MKEERLSEDDSLHRRIEKALSEILSDKHDCKVTLRFVPKDKQRSEGRWKSA